MEYPYPATEAQVQGTGTFSINLHGKIPVSSPCSLKVDFIQNRWDLLIGSKT